MKLSNFLHDLALAIQEFDLDFDCFSKGQLESKEWLVKIMKDLQQHLKINYGTIFILCGWYGILSSIISLNDIKFNKIRSFDIDPYFIDIANRINRTSLQDNWKFQAVVKDISTLNFNSDKYRLWSYKKEEWFDVIESPDTIINTSCEHISPDWFKNISTDKLIILQSNNFWEGNGHINCVSDLNEFKEMFPLKTINYAGELHFDKYSRFMLIGTT